MTPSSAPTPSWGRSLSPGLGSAALGLENRRKKTKTKTLSPVIPFREATGRGGKCTAHYSKRAGGQGASWQAEPRVFAGSLPPDTEAPLVAITAVWILPEFISQLIKGAAFLFFPFHFFFFFFLPCTSLNTSQTVHVKTNPGFVPQAAAGGWGEEEEGREGRAPLAELLLVGARGWSGPGSLQDTGTPRGAPQEASKPLATQMGPQRSRRVARTGTRGGL